MTVRAAAITATLFCRPFFPLSLSPLFFLSSLPCSFYLSTPLRLSIFLVCGTRGPPNNIRAPAITAPDRPWLYTGLDKKESRVGGGGGLAGEKPRMSDDDAAVLDRSVDQIRMEANAASCGVPQSGLGEGGRGGGGDCLNF